MFMNVVEAIFNIQMYVAAHLTVWAEYAGWGIGVASLLQYLKRKYDIDKAKGFSFLGWWQMDGPRIMAALYALAAAASAGLTWFIDPANRAYIPDRFAILVTVGLAIHRFIVSPSGAKLEKKLAPYIQALQQLQTMEQSIVAKTTVKAALPPAAAASGANMTQASPVVGSVIRSNDTSGR